MSQPTKYRKKPVEIEAAQFDGSVESSNRILGWIGSHDGTAVRRTSEPRMLIDTLEGTMSANPGDFIIRGVQGEFYPCKPDIFAATYDLSGAAGGVATHPVVVAENDRPERIVPLAVDRKAADTRLADRQAVMVTREQLLERLRIGGIDYHRKHDKQWRDNPWKDGINVDLDEQDVLDHLVDFILDAPDPQLTTEEDER
jgi:hypothetical protein